MEILGSDEPRGLDERRVLRAAHHAGAFVDAWLTEGETPVRVASLGELTLREAEEGAGGEVRLPVADLVGLRAAAARARAAVDAALASRPGLHLARRWARIPSLGDPAGAAAAYREGSGAPAPAASSEVLVDAQELVIEIFAAREAPRLLDNRRYALASAGRVRAAIVSHRGKRLLVGSAAGGTAGSPGAPALDVRRQLHRAVDELRVLASQFNLKPQGIEYGFGLEDLISLRVVHALAEDRPALEAAVRRYVDPDCRVSFLAALPADEPGARVALEAVFLKKGEYLRPDRRKYAKLADGRIRVESLELHVTEHCNLRCRGCDAMSPLNDERFLGLAEAERVLAFMAKHVRADIFKLMGGEPLLHPGLCDLIDLVRRSGVSRVVRLTTNGLLLHRMPDRFWQGLDRLTVSSYASAPVPPDHVAVIEEKSERFGVVLNLKRIDQFNEIELTEPILDPARVQGIYDDCWIRHRSLVVRDGVFFKCTRAAYLDDFRRRLALPSRPGDVPSYEDADGVPLDAPDFAERALAYLDDPAPLASCRYCLGAAGKLVPHTQLTRREVGVLLGRAAPAHPSSEEPA